MSGSNCACETDTGDREREFTFLVSLGLINQVNCHSQFQRHKCTHSLRDEEDNAVQWVIIKLPDNADIESRSTYTLVYRTN